MTFRFDKYAIPAVRRVPGSLQERSELDEMTLIASAEAGNFETDMARKQDFRLTMTVEIINLLIMRAKANIQIRKVLSCQAL